MSRDQDVKKPGTDASARRLFVQRASTAAMAAGVVASYGTFAAFLGRFLYPTRGKERWIYVARVAQLRVGESMSYRIPGGENVNVVRRAETADETAFVALSSTCPHLGCRVNWEPANERFFCPCHNGVFTPDGVATEGPPGKAGQQLSSYPLRVDSGLLYIEVGAGAGGAVASANDGHDPCLSSERRA